MDPLRVYSQWQGNTIVTDLPRLKTEKYWKRIWEKDNDPKLLQDLRISSQPLKAKTSYSSQRKTTRKKSQEVGQSRVLT